MRYIEITCPLCDLSQHITNYCRSCGNVIIYPLAVVTENLVHKALKMSHYDVKIASKLLGISSTTLYRRYSHLLKVKKHRRKERTDASK